MRSFELCFIFAKYSWNSFFCSAVIFFVGLLPGAGGAARGLSDASTMSIDDAGAFWVALAAGGSASGGVVVLDAAEDAPEALRRVPTITHLPVQVE